MFKSLLLSKLLLYLNMVKDHKYFKAAFKKLGITNRALAKELGYGETHLSRLLTGHFPITEKTKKTLILRLTEYERTQRENTSKV